MKIFLLTFEFGWESLKISSLPLKINNLSSREKNQLPQSCFTWALFQFSDMAAIKNISLWVLVWIFALTRCWKALKYDLLIQEWIVHDTRILKTSSWMKWYLMPFKISSSSMHQRTSGGRESFFIETDRTIRRDIDNNHSLAWCCIDRALSARGWNVLDLFAIPGIDPKPHMPRSKNSRSIIKGHESRWH